MDSLLEHESHKMELFFKRIRYMILLSEDREYSIKEIHIELDINDRQVSRELKELESYGLINLRNEGKNVLVSISNIGLKILHNFNHNLEDRPLDLEKKSKDRIISFINKYNTANNEDSKRMALRKINESFWDIKRTNPGIIWEKETEIIKFINETLENMDHYDTDTLQKIFDIITVIIESGYFNKNTLNIFNDTVHKMEINDDKRTISIFNNTITFCIRLMEKKPEHKEQIYDVLLYSLRKIKSENEEKYYFIRNERNRFKNFPEDIKEALLNELFNLMDNKKADDNLKIVEEVIEFL